MSVTRRRLRGPITVAAAIAVAIGVAIGVMVAVRAPSPDRGPSAGGITPSGSPTQVAPLPPTLIDGAVGFVLAGITVDAVGGPVAGAEIAVESEPPLAAPAAVVLATTDASGRFTMAVPHAGRYRLKVGGAGLVPAELRGVDVPTDEVRVVVAREVRIDGTVLDGSTPLANATVALRGDAIGGGIETHTDPAGVFHFPDLPEGRYQLYAFKGPLVARTMPVSRQGNGPFLPLALRVEPGTIIVGRVVDRDEGTGLLAAVELRPSVGDEAPRYARTGDDGVFRVEGIPHGAWIADAFAPGFTSPGGVELAAGQGNPELALQRGATLEGRVIDAEGRPIAEAFVRALVGSGPGASEHSLAVQTDQLRRYSGVVAAALASTGVAGADPQLVARGELGVLLGAIPPIPPPGAVVAFARPAVFDPTMVALAAEPAPIPVEPARAAIWTTGADGRYRITGLPKGKVVALAVARGLAEGRSRTVAVELGSVHANLDITLAAGTYVVGTIADQHGVPVAGASVRATPAIGAAVDAYADPSGAFRIGPLIGDVEVTASAYGHASSRAQLTLPPTTGSTPAEVTRTFVLVVADAVLNGVIDDATGATVPAATLEVTAGGGIGRRAVAGPDGGFSIDLLPPGPLRIRVRHPDYPTVELDATAASRGGPTARLRIPLGGAVEGVILDAASGAPLAGIAITAAGPGEVVASATTTKSGTWRLGPLTPGRWRVSAKASGYLVATRELDVEAAPAPGAVSMRDVRIELARGALLAGTVRDDRGQRLIGVTVAVVRSDGTGVRAEGVTNSQGEFRIRDTPTGEVALIARRGDAGGSLRVTVRPGDELLTLELTIR